MTAKTLLHLDANQLLAWRWHKGSLTLEASFTADPAGTAAFDAWLPQRQHGTCTLLADVTEESFLAEAVPHVGGRDRRALLQRKLAQAFHGSPLALFRALGRDKAGRRDEHMLFIGLPHAAFFEPWLIPLRTHQVPLAGLYSGALVADVLAQRIPFAAPRFLLMNLGRAGIRVSFFEAGRLRFSHLKPQTGADIGALAVACGAEATRICDYLHGQRLAPRDEALPCLILAHPEHHGVFATHCSNTPELEFLLLDLAATSRRLGLANPQEDSSADLLWLQVLASHPPREQFAPDSARHFHHIRLGASSITGTAATLCVAGMLYAGLLSWQGLGLAEDTARNQAEAARLESRYRARMTTLPPLPVQADKLRAIATRYTQLEQRTAQPREMLTLISRTLERFPEVELEHVAWTLGSLGETRPTSATAPVLVTAILKCSLPAGQPADTPEAFARALRENDSLTVTLLGQPQNSGPILRGSSDDKSAAAPAGFELRVGRRL